MRKEIEINGCVETPPEMTMDDFTDEFIRFVESKGWSFGGGFQEIVDGYYIMPDGSKGRSIVMNNTKWNEIGHKFWNIECNEDILVEWDVKFINYDYVENYECTWSHFGSDMVDHKQIEWLKIRLTPENRTRVIEVLKAVHVPGEVTEDAAFVYGYRTDVDYI